MSSHEILTAEAHRNLRVRIDRGVELGDGVMSSLVVPNEFRAVQDEYPILFRLSPERDSFQAFAIFGFETGENLFLDGDRWDASRRPLSMDIQPFLIGRDGGESGDEPAQVHVDMASPRLDRSGKGVALFDDLGRPTPFLDMVAEQLGALDAGYRETGAFFDALRRYDLLEPIVFDFTLADGASHRFVGFHAINEDRLHALSATALGDLHDNGHLMPIFMAVASVGRFQALIDRKNRRLAGA
ncbi:multidrug transporter [Sphingomonas koreensis]|nr:multidrug transporter [Sphingomonas koreensis]